MLPRRWSHLARHGLLGTTLLGAAAPNARAESCDDRAESSVTLVVGLQVSPKPKLVGGIEGRKCLGNASEGMLRIELGGDKPRLIAGARARPFESATDDSDREHLGLEAGAFLDTRGRFGVHLAATYGTHFAYFAAQAQQLVGGEASPMRFSLIGGFSPWTTAKSTAVPGRPISHEGRMLCPDVTALPCMRSAEDRAVRDHFARSAQLEYSSVWTFLRLAEELAAVGAPAALVAAALDAADDEVRHAELCAQAAGGISLSELPAGAARPRFSARSTRALAVLAQEAWLEGCLNEAAAANEARFASVEASGSTATMLSAIATDEARHAELSWAVLAWIFDVAPAVASTTIAGLPAHAPIAAVVDPALVRRGVPAAWITLAAWSDAERDARERFAALVA